MPSAPDPISPLRVEEYRALRATIRERGTRRMTLVIVTLGIWAAVALSVGALSATPISTLIGLVLLAAGFEAGFALHVGVERVGRYLQVTYEQGPDAPQWEHTAQRFAKSALPAAGRVDPLFSVPFLSATALNLVMALLYAIDIPAAPVEPAFVVLLHAALVIRILRARQFAARQREIDLEVLSAE